MTASPRPPWQHDGTGAAPFIRPPQDNHVADTDQQPIPRRSAGVDWKAFAQYVGVTVGGLSLSIGAWLHGALIGHGERLTTIETREIVREKQNEKDAAATATSLQEIKTATGESLKEIKADIKDLSKSMEAVRLELARDRRPASASGGMP